MKRDDAISLVAGHLYGNFATMEQDEAEAFAAVAVDALQESGAIPPEFPEWAQSVSVWMEGGRFVAEIAGAYNDLGETGQSVIGRLAATPMAAIGNALEGLTNGDS